MDPKSMPLEAMIGTGTPSEGRSGLLCLLSAGCPSDSSLFEYNQAPSVARYIQEAAAAQDRILGQFAADVVRWAEKELILLGYDFESGAGMNNASNKADLLYTQKAELRLLQLHEQYKQIVVSS